MMPSDLPCLNQSMEPIRPLSRNASQVFDERGRRRAEDECGNSLKGCSSRVLNQTDDGFSDLDRAFPVRKVANTFE